MEQVPSTHTGFALPAPAQMVPLLAPRQSSEAPQNVVFVFGSMQLVPHLRSGAAQLAWHAPPLHTAPAAHTSPSFSPAQSPLAPQKALSVCGSTHVVPHLICGGLHVSRHVPSLQTVPKAQVSPSLAPAQSSLAPQKALSVCGSTHVVPHLIWPGGQLISHVDATQTYPGAQAFVQLPQCAGSLETFTQLSPHRIVPPTQSEELESPPHAASTSTRVTANRARLLRLLLCTGESPTSAR